MVDVGENLLEGELDVGVLEGGGLDERKGFASGAGETASGGEGELDTQRAARAEHDRRRPVRPTLGAPHWELTLLLGETLGNVGLDGAEVPEIALVADEHDHLTGTQEQSATARGPERSAIRLRDGRNPARPLCAVGILALGAGQGSRVCQIGADKNCKSTSEQTNEAHNVVVRVVAELLQPALNVLEGPYSVRAGANLS